MINLADFLARRGHHVTVVCREHDALVVECRKRRIPCHPIQFGMDFSPKTMMWFWKLFKKEHTEVVMTNISKGFRTGGIVAKLKGVAHINRVGAPGDLKQTLKTRLFYTFGVNCVFVCSQFLFDYFASQDFLRHKLRWFHNALIVPDLKIVRNSPVKFAIVAKLSKPKQVDKVLQVFARIMDVPWELHIGGFGEELEPLQQLARELHIQQHVHFAGKVHPYEFLDDKDAGILYSSEEAFGYSVIEYMACSCAVIASNTGGIPEIVTPDVDGLLVDPHDPDTLEAAIRLLITNVERREELIHKGYETVQHRFTREAIFPHVEAEIQRTIADVQK
jgi:glycosyltransferase involved in cell wall biosynthesis